VPDFYIFVKSKIFYLVFYKLLSIPLTGVFKEADSGSSLPFVGIKLLYLLSC